MTARPPDEAGLDKLTLSRRLEAFASASALTMLPSFASIAILVTVYAGSVSAGLLAVWAMAASAIIAGRILVGLRLRPDAPEIGDLEEQWRRVTAALVLGSTSWAISLPLAATISSSALQHASFAIIGAVLFSGVLLLHRAAPAAATYHVVALGAGLGVAEMIALGRGAWPLLALIAVYAATLAFALRAQDRHFRTACLVELQRRQSESTVRMLLNEHEAQAADWLWTADANGALRGVSERLADLLGSTPEALEGQDFVTLIEPGRERDRIAALLAERATFRDEPVAVMVDGERRFWRLSGHPRSDGRMSGVGRDVTDQRQIEERVRAMAYVDPLTGLANRHLFNQRLRELLGEDGSEPKPAALLYLDLDDFKAVNDLHGHLFGDALLREMGDRLRRNSRDGDLVARLGGDEFAILVEAPAGDGILIARAHRLLAAAREPFQIEGHTARVCTSIGIARASGACDAMELMRRVDLALYAAKAKGRDQLALFDETLDRRARERRALELELREALGRGEMVLHYQPIIALQSGATIGYEALLRWQHPDRGLLAPDSFLTIAEDAGLMSVLGNWVIRQALEDVAEWSGDFRLSINLSPSQIRHPLLVETIDGALAAAGFAANRLELEITEQVLLNDTAASAATLGRLRALGAEIALDDFGTGYSSLSYLRRFRFDRVKIDRSFVADIESSDEAQAIVSAITRLAQALGMKTTAEGVERREQLDLLRKLGCDEAQGFLILRPVEARLIEDGRHRGEDLPGPGAEIEDYRESRRAHAATGPRIV